MAHLSEHRKKGFTLVELLVVLGIIAILIAMLIPSLSAARAQANRAKCLNNIRQIGIGIQVYAHDYGELPPPTILSRFLPLKVFAPAFYAERRSGLLALQPSSGFERFYLSCPQGWASGGDPSWYQVKGMNATGAAYMDYAYWAGRYQPTEEYDVRAASFTYRRGEKTTKILVTDIVVDQGADGLVVGTVGNGNHASNHSGPFVKVQMTDGRGKRLSTYNSMRSAGASVLFSDYHADWYAANRLTLQDCGLCYPPPPW